MKVVSYAKIKLLAEKTNGKKYEWFFGYKVVDDCDETYDTSFRFLVEEGLLYTGISFDYSKGLLWEDHTGTVVEVDTPVLLWKDETVKVEGVEGVLYTGVLNGVLFC